MSNPNEFLSRVLSQGKRALAAYATNSLLESQPEAAEGFGPDPFAAWQDWLADRIEELGAAVASNEAQLFAGQIQWGRDALASRGISAEHFRAGLENLRAVLDEELPEALRPAAREYLDTALASFDGEPKVTRLESETTEGRLCSEYLAAMLEGNSSRASQLVLDAIDGGLAVPDAYTQVILPAQQEVGVMWLKNEISVAEEHFVSQAARKIMAQILPRAEFAPANSKTFLAAAVEGNQHDIGLQAVADFFEMAGWRSIYLGASVPVRDVVQAIADFKVDLLGLSASQSVQLAMVKKTVAAVREGAPEIKILVGGAVFSGCPELVKEIGVDGFAKNPTDAVRIGNELVHS